MYVIFKVQVEQFLNYFTLITWIIIRFHLDVEFWNTCIISSTFTKTIENSFKAFVALNNNENTFALCDLGNILAI